MSVELTSPRIILRAPQRADAEAMCQAACESVVEVGRWLPWCHRAYTLSDAHAWIDFCLDVWERGEAYPFFIFDRGDNALAGGCTLNEIDWLRRRANLGYWIRTSHMGRGLAGEAARLTARFGLETLAMQRLEIVAAEGNTASRRVAEKLGAFCEGLARNRLRIRDVPHDAMVFSLIPSDVRKWDEVC
jgi:RimJ/RimL family protein N-acetyltransferase